MVNSKFSGCNVIDGLTTDDDISNIFSSKISSLLNSDLDQPSRNNFISDLTNSNSISKSDRLTSEISSTITLNALDQRKENQMVKVHFLMFLMELDKAVFYHPYFSFFILMNF